MTTIESVFGKKWIVQPGSRDGYIAVTAPPAEGHHCVQVTGLLPTAELLATLDAVPRAENVPLKLYEDERAHWKARAEKAEANCREVKQDNRDLVEQSMQNANRATKAETEANMLRDRLNAAEAKLARIGNLARVDGSDAWALNAIRAIISPEPPFVLPTTAGARFECQDWEGKSVVFRALNGYGGATVYEYGTSGSLWSGKSVMAEMTDHRLIEDGE